MAGGRTAAYGLIAGAPRLAHPSRTTTHDPAKPSFAGSWNETGWLRGAPLTEQSCGVRALLYADFASSSASFHFDMLSEMIRVDVSAA